jgi:hypothetical protein
MDSNLRFIDSAILDNFVQFCFPVRGPGMMSGYIRRQIMPLRESAGSIRDLLILRAVRLAVTVTACACHHDNLDISQ